MKTGHLETVGAEGLWEVKVTRPDVPAGVKLDATRLFFFLEKKKKPVLDK